MASSPVIRLPAACAPGHMMAPPLLWARDPSGLWRAVWVPPLSMLKGVLAEAAHSQGETGQGGRL